MISKIPKWAWTAAWLLAFVAGIVNAVALLGFEHQSVTHLTGATSFLGLALASLDFPKATHLIAIIASFIAGCAISGFLVKDSALQVGRRYGAALLLESLLLSIAVPMLARGNSFGIYAASCACGLQNALVSAYSGTLVRTTHLTGMFTDLGIFLGHALRKLPVDARRLRLCLLIISGFLCGGIAGAAAFQRYSYATLFAPAGITTLLALLYYNFIVRKQPTTTTTP